MIALKHLYSVLGYPIVVTMIIPILILFNAINRDTRLDIENPNAIFAIIAGVSLLVSGFILLLSTMRVLSDVGDEEEDEEWDPTKYFVIEGTYAFIRNPLTVAMLMILIGEVCLTGSHGLAIYAGIFFLGSHVYIVSFEEPMLVRKFGGKYREYADHVHRWYPRRHAWNPVHRLY